MPLVLTNVGALSASMLLSSRGNPESSSRGTCSSFYWDSFVRTGLGRIFRPNGILCFSSSVETLNFLNAIHTHFAHFYSLQSLVVFRNDVERLGTQDKFALVKSRR